MECLQDLCEALPFVDLRERDNRIAGIETLVKCTSAKR